MSDFNKKIEFTPNIFAKYSNIKFHENPSSGSRDVSCGQTDSYVENSNFENAPKDRMLESTTHGSVHFLHSLAIYLFLLPRFHIEKGFQLM